MKRLLCLALLVSGSCIPPHRLLHPPRVPLPRGPVKPPAPPVGGPHRHGPGCGHRLVDGKWVLLPTPPGGLPKPPLPPNLPFPPKLPVPPRLPLPGR